MSFMSRILLHDIGKGLPGDHSQVGANIAEAFARGLGLSPAETAAVSWLARYHLVMSDTAQKRDISDPKTVRDFVQVVQSPEMLRLLLVLTVADIRAVGPGVFNGWKGQLLRELYYEAEALMSGSDAKPGRAARIDAAKSKLRDKISDLPPAARERALSRHYDPYWLAFDEAAYERQAQLMAEADGKGALLAMSARSAMRSARSRKSRSTRLIIRACSPNSPAPSRRPADPSSMPKPSRRRTASR